MEIRLVTKEDFLVEFIVSLQFFQDPVTKVSELSTIVRLQHEGVNLFSKFVEEGCNETLVPANDVI